MAKDDIIAEIGADAEAPVAKKAKIDPKSTSAEEAAFSTALDGISDIENKINTIEDECSIEICKLEQKFVQRKAPLYDLREQHISKIDNFWQIALINHPSLSCLISEKDEDALSYLKSIKVEQVTREEEGGEGDHKYVRSLNHSIIFEFKENPYFENKCLSKHYFQVLDEIISEGEAIKWKEGNNLIEQFEVEARKLGRKENGGGDTNDDEEADIDHAESFFAWFADHEDAQNDDTGDLIKDDLWMKALHYYISEEMEGEGAGDDDDDEVDLEVGSGEENDDDL